MSSMQIHGKGLLSDEFRVKHSILLIIWDHKFTLRAFIEKLELDGKLTVKFLKLKYSSN